MRALPTIITLATLLAGCGTQGAPDGQVIASVNGEEITRSELNAALSDVNAGGKADKATLQNAALDKLVVEKLIVQAAKQDKLDRSQEYLLVSRRANDQILAKLYARRIVEGLRTPYPRDISRFVADNPSRFAQRVLLTADQLRFPDGSISDSRFSDAHTMDEVAAKLSSSKIQFQRGHTKLDSATLDPSVYRQLTALPPGEPFIVHEQGLTVISTILQSEPAPLEGKDAERAAGQLIQGDTARDALAKQLAALRQSATVKYQQGFGAPKPSSGAGTQQK